MSNLYGATAQTQLSGNPDRATDQTIAAMIAFVFDSDRSGLVHRLAVNLAAQCPQRDYECQLRKIYDWLAAYVRFKRDTSGAEHVRHPDQLITEVATYGATAADCDDMATLGAALVRALGFPAVLTVVAPGAIGPFVHVYFGAMLGGRRIPLDPQERTPFGQDPRHGRIKHYPVVQP